ncbi:MAG: HAD hydrolase-like protein [Paracoccaceae bacterium]
MFGRQELEHLDAGFLQEDAGVYDQVGEILLIGSSGWTETRQELLEASLCNNPRPVLVANPDTLAPQETCLSKQPGHFAHRLADVTGVTPEFFGKPFNNIFAMARLPEDTDPARVVMVGDTLQTDILGGRVAGLKTALRTSHGSLKGMNVNDVIDRSGISGFHYAGAVASVSCSRAMDLNQFTTFFAIG